MINVVTTQANVVDVGREMCENDTVRKVTFTGSTPVAKLLYGMAAKGLKKCVSTEKCVAMADCGILKDVD